jgi:hypothetical protein
MAILGYAVNTCTVSVSGINALGATNPQGVQAPQGPIVIKASEAIQDTSTLAAYTAAGGLVANPNDPTIIAAITICQQKMLGKYRGQNEDLVNAIMFAAYTRAASQGEIITYPLATGTANTSDPEQEIGQTSGPGVITGAFFVPNAAFTPAGGSNNLVLNLNIYTSTGALVGSLAAATCANATPFVKWVRFALGTIQNNSYTDGMTVTYTGTVTGTFTRPAGQIFVVGYR